MSLQVNIELPRRDFLLKIEADFGRGLVGIFGPSGAGKTSLFSLLAGIEKPAKGSIVLNGRVLSDVDKGIHIPSHERRIGMVFQEKLLFPHMKVKENLMFGVKYVKKEKRRITLEEVVELLNLGEFLDAYPSEISGGEQQRVGIGRALLTSPEMLLLDEPFNAVDTQLRLSILPYLKKIHEVLEIPMLVISHDLPDIQRLTDQIFVMEKGLCRGFGQVLDILSENRTLLESSGIVNTIQCHTPKKIEKGLYQCEVDGLPEVELKVPEAPSERFTIVVPPHEVALSSGKIDGISIQNQIKGVVTEIINSADSLYCMVDVGIKLASKVTPHTVESMNLTAGSTVWCLFKAHGIHY